MQSRIRIYNRRGVPLCELEADVDRSWILNDAGTAAFVLGRNDPKLRQDYIEYGNYLLITSPHIKPWVGVIDTPRSWISGGVKVKAYGAEYLMAYRYPVDVNTVKNIVMEPETLYGPSGALFQQIIERINRPETTLVRLGDVWLGDQVRQQTFSSGHYLKHVQEIAARVPCDFEFIPIISDDGLLTVKANWFERKGQDKSAWMVLEEGFNVELENEALTEQGEIWNHVTGVSEGSTTNTRLASSAEDVESVARFGLRQSDAMNYYGVTQLETVVANTKSALAAKKYPRKTVRVSVTDVNLFSQLQEGDTVMLVLHSAGFLDDGTIGYARPTRILGMGLTDTKAKLDLVMDEVI